MKSTILAASTLMLALLFTVVAQAQPVTFENHTPCEYVVKVNVVPAPNCGFTGVGPVIIVPPGATFTIPDPTGPGDWIPGYGIHENLPGMMPVTNHAPGCGPVNVPLPPTASIGCAFSMAEFHGHRLVIR